MRDEKFPLVERTIMARRAAFCGSIIPRAVNDPQEHGLEIVMPLQASSRIPMPSEQRSLDAGSDIPRRPVEKCVWSVHESAHIARHQDGG